MPNINNDIGHQETEALIEQAEKDMYREYERAAAEMQKKLRVFFLAFQQEDKKQKARLMSGEITLTEYKQWRQRKILLSTRIADMRDVLARDAVNADIIAMNIVKGYMPEAYAIGRNYGTYLVESSVGVDTSFTLYDRHTVERLWRENPKLLPDPTPGSPTEKLLRENKDLQWNKQHIQSEITQGILQGESLDKVAERMQNVTDMDYRAAKRNAGTMLTSAQNGGRIDSFNHAQSMGIDLKKVWLATLDGHTRQNHRLLDGQTKPVNEPFVGEYGKIMYPGDPSGDPADVYNCRCTLVTQVAGYEKDMTDLGLREHRGLYGRTYEEWKNAKDSDPLIKAARNYNSDTRQHDVYRQLLGNKVPATMREFQQIKYYQPDKWDDLKKQARKARREQQGVSV